MPNWPELIGVELEDSGLDVQDGVLEAGRIPVHRYLAQNGGDPIYLYDGASLNGRLDRLATEFGHEIGLRYAVKANPNPDLLRFLAGRVEGFDVASSAELDAAIAAGASPAAVSLAGPGKSDALLRHAVTCGVAISAESERELSSLADIARTSRATARVLIRVNPPFGLRGSGMRMSGAASPFGIDSEAVPAVLRALPPELDLEGLHVFCGSQCLDDAAICEMHAAVFALMSGLAIHSPVPLRRVTIGSGLGIPYATGDQPVALEPVASAFRQAANQFSTAHPATRIELELGRYLVGEAGIYACRIIEIKQSRGERFLITNGGMHHHLAATGNLGQIIKRPYPMCLAERVVSERTERVNVVGPLCTPLDVLGRQVTLPPARVGDTVVIFQSGAYGFTASPTAFLGHPPPTEVFIPPAS